MPDPKPTRAPGGGRKPLVVSLEQAVLEARCRLFPAGHYPGSTRLAAALGISRQKFIRFLAGKAALTPAQLVAGNALLDACGPARWPAAPPPEADFAPPA